MVSGISRNHMRLVTIGWIVFLQELSPDCGIFVNFVFFTSGVAVPVPQIDLPLIRFAPK